MKKTLEQKQKFWSAHFENSKKSSLSQSDYCKQNNIVESQFYYWKKHLGLTRLQAKPQVKNKKSGFVAAQVSPYNPTATIIHLKNGISIEGFIALDDNVLTIVKQLNTL